MKSVFPAMIGLLLIYIFYGLFLSQYNVQVLPRELRPANPTGFYDYKGVINVHSLASTGGATANEILRAAQEADLDFLILNDLNQQNPNESIEGYHDKVLALVGGEYSYINSRLLTPQVPTQFDFKGAGQSQVYFADLLSQENSERKDPFIILAHPFKPKFQWTGEYPPGLDALEIINLKSLWQHAWIHNKVSFFWTLFILPFNDRLALLRLFRDPAEELDLWDKLSQKRHVVGLLGADAESRIRIADEFWANFPSYQSLFSIASNHILLRSELTGNPRADKEKLLQALQRGQFYFALDLLAQPRGFNAYIKTKSGQIYTMGSEVKWSSEMELVIQLPNKPLVPFDIDILKDGQKIMTSNSQTTKLVLYEEGVYRVRVRVIPTFPLPDGKKWVPWIFSNPFYVRSL